MPLGMEVGLGPGDFVLDGNPAPPSPKKVAQPLIFGPCLLWPNGWMDQDATLPCLDVQLELVSRLFTARRNARIASAISYGNSVCLSVCLSVRLLAPIP